MGETEFIPYQLAMDDSPLAVAHYILDSDLSTNNAETKLAR